MANDKDATSLGPLTLEKIKKLGSPKQAQEYRVFPGLSDLVDRENDEMKQLNNLINEVKQIDFEDMAPTNLTFFQIKSMTDEELLKALSGELNPKTNRLSDGSIQLVSNELLTRQIKESSKPHWTVTPTFIVACVASLLAAISIIVTIYFSVFYKVENNDEHANQSYAVAKNAAPK